MTSSVGRDRGPSNGWHRASRRAAPSGHCGKEGPLPTRKRQFFAKENAHAIGIYDASFIYRLFRHLPSEESKRENRGGEGGGEEGIALCRGAGVRVRGAGEIPPAHRRSEKRVAPVRKKRAAGTNGRGTPSDDDDSDGDGNTRGRPGEEKKARKNAMSCPDRDGDECCPITLVPFRTITPARTTFLPCCHRFDSDAIGRYIADCLARRSSSGTVTVPCPVCRYRVPPDYLVDMGISVSSAAASTAPPRSAVPASERSDASMPDAGAPGEGGPQGRVRRSARAPAPVVIVVDGDSDAEHERTAEWIDGSDDDDDDDDDDDSVGSLDDFIVEDGDVDPDEDYVPGNSAVTTTPTATTTTSGDDDDDDDDTDYSDDDDDDCTCETDEED